MTKLELTYAQYRDYKINHDIAEDFKTYDEVIFEGVKCMSPEDLEEKFQAECEKIDVNFAENFAKSVELNKKMEEKRL